jgi:preprotein translocase subunit SecF
MLAQIIGIISGTMSCICLTILLTIIDKPIEEDPLQD